MRLTLDTESSGNDLSDLLNYFDYVKKEDGMISEEFPEASDSEAVFSLYNQFPDNRTFVYNEYQQFLEAFYNENYYNLFSNSPTKNRTMNTVVGSSLEPDYNSGYDFISMWVGIGNTLPSEQLNRIENELNYQLSNEGWSNIYELQTLLQVGYQTGTIPNYDKNTVITMLKNFVNLNPNSDFYGGVSYYPDDYLYETRLIPYLIKSIDFLGLELDDVFPVDGLENFIVNSMVSNVDYDQAHNPLGLNYSSLFATNPSSYPNGVINTYIRGDDLPLLNTIAALYVIDRLKPYTTINVDIQDTIDLILNQAKTIYWSDDDANGIIDEDPYFSLFPYQNDGILLKQLSFLFERYDVPELTFNDLYNYTKYGRYEIGGYNFDTYDLSTTFDALESISSGEYNLDLLYDKESKQKLIQLLETSLLTNITTSRYDGVEFVQFNITMIYSNPYEGVHLQQNHMRQPDINSNLYSLAIDFIDATDILNASHLLTNETKDGIADLIYYSIVSDFVYSYDYNMKIYLKAKLMNLSEKYATKFNVDDLKTQLVQSQTLSGGFAQLNWMDDSLDYALNLINLDGIVFNSTELAKYLVQSKITNNGKQGWDYRIWPNNSSISIPVTTKVLRFLYETGQIQHFLSNGQLNKTKLLTPYIDYLSASSSDYVFNELYSFFDIIMPFKYLGYTKATLPNILPNFAIEDNIQFLLSLQITDDNYSNEAYNGGFGSSIHSGMISTGSSTVKYYTNLAAHLLKFFEATHRVDVSSLQNFIQSQRVDNTQSINYGLFTYSVEEEDNYYPITLEPTALYYESASIFGLTLNEYDLSTKILNRIESEYIDIYETENFYDAAKLIGYAGISINKFDRNKLENTLKHILTSNHLPLDPYSYWSYGSNLLSGVKALEELNMNSTVYFDRSLNYLASLQVKDSSYTSRIGGFKRSTFYSYPDTYLSQDIMSMLHDYNATDLIDLNLFGRYVYQQYVEVRQSSRYTTWMPMIPLLNLISFVSEIDLIVPRNNEIIPTMLSKADKSNGLYLSFVITDVFGNINPEHNLSISIDGSNLGHATFQTGYSIPYYTYNIDNSILGSIGDSHMIEISSDDVPSLYYTSNVTIVEFYLKYYIHSQTDTIKQGERFFAEGKLVNGLNREINDVYISSSLETPGYGYNPSYYVDYWTYGTLIILEVSFRNYPRVGDYDLDITFHTYSPSYSFDVKFQFKVIENTDISTTTSITTTNPNNGGSRNTNNRLTGPEEPPLAIPGFSAIIVMSGIMILTVIKRKSNGQII